MITVTGVSTLLRIFRDFYTGLTVWDPTVPATVNVAFTDCGINDRLPVRYGHSATGIYHYMVYEMGVNVSLDLNNKFTGVKNTKIKTSS